MKSFQEIRKEVENSRQFNVEMKRKRDYVVNWIDSHKMGELMPLCIELKQNRGGAKTYSTLYSALIGGEYEGFSYDGLAPTFEELKEALLFCIEDDNSSVRDVIKSIRRTEKLGDEYSKF